MKLKILIATIAAALGAAATAQGTNQASIRFEGILCKTDTTARAIYCAPTNDHGYQISIDRKAVIVYNLDTMKAVKVYMHSLSKGK